MKALGALTLLVCGAHYADAALQTAPALRVVTASMLVTTSTAFALMAVASIRADDGRWSLTETWARVRETRLAVEEQARLIGHATNSHKKRVVGQAVVIWAFLLLLGVESASLFRFFARWALDWRGGKPSSVEAYVTSGAALSVAAGCVALLLARRGSTPIDTTHSDDSLEAIYRARAPLLGREEILTATTRFHGSTKDVLLRIAAWRPGRRASEQAFARQLARHLERSLVGVEIAREPDLGGHVGVARSAMIAGGSILIVVKRASSLSPEGRARDALQPLRTAWADKPILLVIVETPDDATRPAITRAVAALAGDRVLGVWL